MVILTILCYFDHFVDNFHYKSSIVSILVQRTFFIQKVINFDATRHYEIVLLILGPINFSDDFSHA